MTAYTFKTIADLAAATPATDDTATVLGYHGADKEGGGLFRWDGTSTATVIAGMVIQPGAGGTGRWFRVHDGAISNKMCGAKVDGTAFDDAAYAAMDAYVTAYGDVRELHFAPGTSRILQAGVTPTALFVVADIEGLILYFPDCEFQVDIDQSTTASNVAIFEFTNCPRTTVIGMPRFIATNGFTKSYMIANGLIGGKGTIPFQFLKDCSYTRVQCHAEGLLMPVNWARTPRLTVHPERAAFVAAGGSGYAVNDVLTLANIGSAATTNATFTVAAVSGGSVTAVTTTTRGVFPLAGAGLNVADTGFATTVSPSGGTGCKLLPFMADYEAELYRANPATGAGISRFCESVVYARLCYYGHHANYNFAQSRVWADTDYVYRGCVHYGTGGADDETEAWVRQRNYRGDSVAVSSNAGLGTSLKLHLTQLPTLAEDGSVDTTFNTNASAVRMSFETGIPGEINADVTFDVDVGTADNYFGSLFEVDKVALDNADTTNPRPHFGQFAMRGRIYGKGRLDSGLGAGPIIGTNVNVTAAGWTGCDLNWTIADGFRHTGQGEIVVNAKALGSLKIGNVRSDGAITTDHLATSGVTTVSMAPTGPVTVDPGASYRNRNAISGHYPCVGDIAIAANVAVSANLTGSRFHCGTGTGTTLVASLPPAVIGLRYRFQNGISTASSQLHIDPDGSDVIRDAAAAGGNGKKWRLTGLGATVELQCFQTQEWNIVSAYGTQSIEP